MAENDVYELAKQAIEAIADKVKNMANLNIIVAGKTGVGKSTLINGVFSERLAETGVGKPVTPHMRMITKKDFPLTVYDTRGFELGKDVQTEVKNEIVNTIRNGMLTQNINDAIHCIWYCINTTSSRIEPEEIEWLKQLSDETNNTRVPIIIILTQSFSRKKAEEMKQVILNENLDVVQVVPVLADDYEIDDELTIKSYGLDTLVKVMGEVLPNEILDTFYRVQKASVEEKIRYAQNAVKTATIAAMAEAASPIPFSDSALLIPTQLTMITSITVIFGFDLNKSIITALLSSTLGAGGATILGKTVVAGLLKLIPGAGTAIGGAINAGTAGVITAALGEAYIGIMELVFKGEMNIQDLETAKGKELLTNMYKERLKIQR